MFFPVQKQDWVRFQCHFVFVQLAHGLKANLEGIVIFNIVLLTCALVAWVTWDVPGSTMFKSMMSWVKVTFFGFRLDAEK